MPQKLDADALEVALATLPLWSLEDGEIVRTFEFPDFLGSIAFVNRVAELAEAAAHHPDMDIRYNKVRLALVTHDSSGITLKDIELAAKIDRISH